MFTRQFIYSKFKPFNFWYHIYLLICNIGQEKLKRKHNITMCLFKQLIESLSSFICILYCTTVWCNYAVLVAQGLWKSNDSTN